MSDAGDDGALDVATLVRSIASCADDIEAPPDEAYLAAVQAGVGPAPSFAVAAPKAPRRRRSIEWDVIGRRAAVGVTVAAMLLAVVLVAASHRGAGGAGSASLANPPLPSTDRKVRPAARSTTIAALPLILGANADETASASDPASSSVTTTRATTTTGTTLAVTTTARRPTTTTTIVVVTVPVTEPATTTPLTAVPTTVAPTTSPATTAPATTRPATTVPATTLPATTVAPTTTTTVPQSPGTLTVNCTSSGSFLIVTGAWTGAGSVVVISVPWTTAPAFVTNGLYSALIAVPSTYTTRPIPVAADVDGHHSTTSCWAPSREANPGRRWPGR